MMITRVGVVGQLHISAVICQFLENKRKNERKKMIEGDQLWKENNAELEGMVLDSCTYVIDKGGSAC